MKMLEEELRENEKHIFYDEEDKERIMKLPLLKREQIINERYTKLKDNELANTLRELINTEQPKEPMKIKPTNGDFFVNRELVLANIFKPFIGILKGSFAKFKINDTYAVCKIVAIRKVPGYRLMGKNPQMCTVGFDVDTGKRVVSGLGLTFMSSSAVSQDEFERFLESFSIESTEEISQKYQKIKNEFSRRMTETEIAKAIENRMRDNPKKQTNTERKIEIISKRDEAIQRKDKEKAFFYQKQLEEIEDEERHERRQKIEQECERKRRKPQF